jgi:type IV pilus assembly protein PilY1
MVDLGVGKMDIFMDFDDNGEPEWGTVIIGGEREGGPVWFCLNVTDPNFMTEEGIATKTVLWEYSDVNKLGDSWAFPESGRVKDENDEDRWIVFLTTGANSAGVPYLVALDVTKGEPYKEIHIFYDADNDGVYDAGEIEAEPPLTSVSALDDYKDGVFDDYVDTVYFGDIEGRVWKMTIGSETDDWKPYILFEATDGTGTSQPLSIPPSIAFDQKYRTRLYFGSGKYREKEDVISTQTQTFYCVMDTNLDYSNILYDELPLTREDLDEVEFLDLDRYGNIINNPIPTENVPGCREIGNVVKFIPYGTRTTREKRDIEDDFGWYIDLSYRGCDGQAERSTESPLIYGGYVFFSSVVPTTEKCEAGGYPYLIMLDYLTGLPPEKGVIEEIPEELEGKLASLHISSKEKEEGEERRGGGVPSRPVLGPGGKQLIIQLSAEGELIRINLKRIEPVSILSWGEEGFIECHACE